MPKAAVLLSLPAAVRGKAGLRSSGGAHKVELKSHSKWNVEPQAFLVPEETQAERFPSPETSTAARPL